jgi:hypothetical protein
MSDRRILAVLLLVGLVLRLTALVIMPAQDLTDAGAYVAMGKEFLENGRSTDTHFMPLYPLLTALTGGAAGVKLLDVAVSTILIALVHALTRTLVQDRIAALVAAGIAAVYPHFIFYSVVGLSETTYMALLIAAFLSLYHRRVGWGCALLVLSILERPVLDMLAPVLVVLFARYVHRLPWRQAGRDLAKYAVLYCLMMAPWWAHNYVQYDQFVRLNLADGIILYSGNNPMNTSGGGVAYGEPDDDMDLGRFSTIEDPVLRNDAMKAEAFAFIRENPGTFLRLAVIKFTRFWRPWPYSSRYQRPEIVALSLFSVGPVMVLAAIGALRASPRLLPVFVLMGYLTLVHMATIASVRYRLPLEPFLIVLATIPLVRTRAKPV